jgi:uncharacterized protein YsxB (DUF464 family)
MIVAEFFRKNSEIVGFKIKGHAGYDEYGKDIACASVSSAIMLTANMITESFGYEAEVSDENEAVVLKAEFFGDGVLQKIFNGLIMHLEMLSQEFKGTIKIKFTEV